VRPLVGRWLKFHLVGAAGIGVQLVVLSTLVSGFGVQYLAATAAAVEAAVLHNFAWHERYTWQGRGKRGVGGLVARLARFHLGNGLVSLVGNLLLMRLFAGWLGWPYLAANVVSIAVCSLANFALGEWFVFR
jgi:putative flippase GtrA